MLKKGKHFENTQKWQKMEKNKQLEIKKLKKWKIMRKNPKND